MTDVTVRVVCGTCTLVQERIMGEPDAPNMVWVRVQRPDGRSFAIMDFCSHGCAIEWLRADARKTDES